MVRIILLLAYCFISALSFCQELDPYKYVHISPHYAYYEDVSCYEEDSDKKLNEFSYKKKKYRAKADTILDGFSYLKRKFSRKGFEVLPSSYSEWPNEALNNIELILWCYPSYRVEDAISIQLSNSTFESFLNVVFPYFDNNRCHTSKCFRECWDSINVYTYSYDENRRIELDLPEAEQSGETLKSLQTYFESTDLDRLEGIYISEMTDVRPYYRIGIKKDRGHYKAIILDSQIGLWQEGHVKAIFKKSSDDGKFFTSWYLLNRKKCDLTSQINEYGQLIVGEGDGLNSTNRSIRFIKTYPLK